MTGAEPTGCGALLRHTGDDRWRIARRTARFLLHGADPA